MVSRRNFAAITSMMLVICFLFLLPQYWKDNQNPYAHNIYAPEGDLPGSAGIWQQPSLTTGGALNAQEYYVAYLGDSSDSTGFAVTSWAEYTKTALSSFESVSALAAMKAKLPDVVIVEGSRLDLQTDLKTLLDWNREGVTLIFAGLPDCSVIQKYPQFRELLGIHRITKSSVQLEAVRLFPGFLLGGERIYGTETQRDRDMMDLNLETPWYRLTEGTEVYLMGEVSLEELPERQYRNERLPALVWRRALNGTNVFVVNGDYLSGSTGIGFLSAIMAENSSYYLYPVVNAQVMTVANFPGMADENNDAMISRYGRGHVALTRDLLWPSLESMSEINGFRMSCFEMPQYHYYDGQEPDSYLISYYLRLMRERNAEAGVSLQHGDDISLAEKWDRDQAFLTQDAQEYRYNAAFLTSRELEEWSGELDFSAVSANLQGRDGVFFFLDEDTLCQAVTHDLLNYTFQSDLELCCMQTALAYTNPMLDMRRVSWPEAEEAGWEVYYERAASNLHTYWKVFKQFDRITVSESDRRIRAFLSMDYTQSRVGDTITLEITGFDAEADFILRTHKEVVSQVVGGTAEELERGAWLIRADSPHVELTVKVDALYEY